MSLHDFWEKCQNDETDDELGSELSERMKVIDYSKDPLVVPDKEDVGAALSVAYSNQNGFPDFMVDGDDFYFINSVLGEWVGLAVLFSSIQLNRNVSDGPCKKLSIKSVSQQHAQHPTGCHTEVSGHVVSPSKSQDGGVAGWLARLGSRVGWSGWVIELVGKLDSLVRWFGLVVLRSQFGDFGTWFGCCGGYERMTYGLVSLGGADDITYVVGSD
ncbi:uncharacterized protein HKW66_Vig0002850 [Vigna angularis]|uniref:Uncharacterized protein n=1 Tax=Phaseolus angularis TaxID=3914 RepID=A0A8T0L9Z1_PHAAN|nr:uncharacterized protein HKW66_Vig0002850 [Vigna angularis]